MKLSVALLPQLLTPGWANTRSAAIVIDTLRFTSTACIALEAGASAVEVLSDIEAARQSALSAKPAKLLCGERFCQKIPGFDLGNSPLEYTSQLVDQRELIFSTTNGTFAVEAAQSAAAVALGSLLNCTAVAQWAQRQTVSDLWLVCAGTDGRVAAEDVLTAGAIAAALQSIETVELFNDSAHLAWAAWKQISQAKGVLDQLQLAQGGKNLIETGFAADVEFVARIDASRCVPERTTDNCFVQCRG